MKKSIFLAVGLFLLTASCTQDEPEEKHITIVVPSRAELEVALSYSDFAFDLLDASIDCSDSDNVLISPMSASLALSMLANGASGSTLDEILATLRLDDDADLEIVNSYNRKISRQLQDSGRDLTFVVANSIWSTDNVGFLPDFENVIADAYDGDSYRTSPENLTKDVNRWISRKTGGIVKEINVNATASDFRLINTLVYKQPWTDAFNSANNTTGPFHNSDNTASTVDFMNVRRDFIGFVDDTCKMACIELGHSLFGFSVVLPQDGCSIDDVVEHIRHKGWFNIEKESWLCDVVLSLPKFRLSNEIDLIEPLRSMGLSKVFSQGSAELDRMRAVGGFVSQTLQTNEIGIDEEGVMAVSTTVIDGMCYDNGEDHVTSFDMILDHPFIFVISEGNSKSILYIGVVNHLDSVG